MALSHGVPVEKYHADNGIFSAKAFKQILSDMDQHVRFSGVGAHHQNGVAKQAICTVMYRAHIMLLHAALRWPEMADVSLWPMALSHAVFLWNNTTNPETGLSPLEVFSCSKADIPIIQQQHVWGCPVYVLHPTLQDGKKLPKWEPRSRRRVFVGNASEFSCHVGLVLHPKTGFISPQFHFLL